MDTSTFSETVGVDATFSFISFVDPSSFLLYPMLSLQREKGNVNFNG
jgi:hypothetical protein